MFVPPHPKKGEQFHFEMGDKNVYQIFLHEGEFFFLLMFTQVLIKKQLSNQTIPGLDHVHFFPNYLCLWGLYYHEIENISNISIINQNECFQE